MPKSASNLVKELIIPESARPDALKEAETLPCLEITKVIRVVLKRLSADEDSRRGRRR